MPQTTIVSLVQYKGFRNKLQALGRMGRPAVAGKKIDGLTFWKPFGTGSGKGFSVKPDFSTFSLLTVFENEEKARKFLASDIMNQYTQTSEAYSHVLMHNLASNGEWGKKQPFKKIETAPATQKIAVITRALIKPRYMYSFWKTVPSISKSMDQYPEIIYNKGIGEWPLVMQATFSMWKNIKTMRDFSYKNPAHASAVRKAMEKGYFSDSLFARFHPFEIQGELLNH